MSLPEPFSSSRHLNSSPGQLSTVLDRDETTPRTSQISQSGESNNSKGDLESSRSTIPFPSASNEQNDQVEDESHTNFTPIIQALRSIIRTVSPSDDGNGRISGQPTPTAKPATPNPSPSPAPAVHPLSSLKSPSETHVRKLSSPLKPSISNVDSLSSSRHEGGPKRVSFDHATSGPTVSMQNLTNVLQMSTNPPAQGSPAPNRSHTAQSTPTKGAATPRSGSRSRSQSPRRFWPLSRLSSPGEPWQPRDPYQLRLQLDQLRRRRETMHKCWDQVLRQLYRHFLLRLPSAYFTRVSRVFEEAELSRVEVQKMIDASKRARTRRLRRGLRQAQSESHHQPADSVDFWPNEREWLTSVVSPSLQHFKQSWDEFMDSLQKEWKTLNVVSALLLSAILTMFQVEGSDQPVMRTAALIALICALWSLTFGCIYILRFSTMRSMHKASRWAEEAQKHTTGIWWNVWVFLALPAVFMAWSVISFCVAILSFSWTTGTPTPPNPISDSAAIGPRLGITFVFLLGLVYFIRAIKTLKKYADPLPRHWALHSPPPLAARDPGAVSELDLERAEGIALGNVKDAADRAEAEEEAQRSQKERGRGLMRAFTGSRW